MRTMRRWAALGALVLALAPTGARAYSFLPAGFAPGEQILSIQVASGDTAAPSVVYNDGTLTLTFSAPVSTITTTLTTYSITLGEVWFDSSVMLSTQTIFRPVTSPPFPGAISATFVNGIVANLTITDVADSFNLLLAADYDDGLKFSAAVNAGAVSGSLGGTPGGLFTPTVGDPGFLFAFGPAGQYFANLSGFQSDGAPVTTLCHLIKNITPCPIPFGSPTPGGELDDFEVNPAATISRTTELVPEPGLASLLLAGLASLLAWGWRRI